MKRISVLIFLMAALIATSCSDDDNTTTPTTKDLNLSINGLADLGPDYMYEGWIIVDGNPVSTGTFSVTSSGDLNPSSFTVDADMLAQATAFVLTIEPYPDSDSAPSQVHLMGGDFSGSSAALSVAHEAAIGDDFLSASGSYILATPTNGANSNELSGIWWLDPTAGPGPSLTLPTLPAGWKYEGWAVIDGTPVTTGKFTSATGADEDDPYSSVMAAPPFPGEDFLINDPMGLTFPTYLPGTRAVITVEPDPDNSVAPFLLKPLVADIPASATDHVNYDMSNNAAASNPHGTAAR